MAMVHQNLYQTKDLSQLNLNEYICSLVAVMLESYDHTPGRIAFLPRLEDVRVLIDSAIPCGLILNELVSNSLKHAFPGNAAGRIEVSLRREPDGEIHLTVADNGVGLAPGVDPRGGTTIGLQTMFALAESQLRAEVSFTSCAGVSCHIRFRDNLYEARV